MKYLFSLCVVFFAAVGSMSAQDAVEGPVMTFEETVVDYGTIEHQADPLREFHFTNTGTEPLIIKNAKGSCGCTVPKYKKEPVMPGESSIIEVRYDTKRQGNFTKTVKIYTNEGEEPHVLSIKGKVLPKDKKLDQSVPKGDDNPFEGN